MSNLFKYTKRVLTSVLAAAVVLTAIPTSAFGAEVLNEEVFVEENVVVNETEEAQEQEIAEEDGGELVVENEEAATTDGSSEGEIEVKGDVESPDEQGDDYPRTMEIFYGTGDGTAADDNTVFDNLAYGVQLDPVKFFAKANGSAYDGTVKWDLMKVIDSKKTGAAKYADANLTDATKDWTDLGFVIENTTNKTFTIKGRPIVAAPTAQEYVLRVVDQANTDNRGIAKFNLKVNNASVTLPASVDPLDSNYKWTKTSDKKGELDFGAINMNYTVSSKVPSATNIRPQKVVVLTADDSIVEEAAITDLKYTITPGANTPADAFSVEADATELYKGSPVTLTIKPKTGLIRLDGTDTVYTATLSIESKTFEKKTIDLLLEIENDISFTFKAGSSDEVKVASGATVDLTGEDIFSVGKTISNVTVTAKGGTGKISIAKSGGDLFDGLTGNNTPTAGTSVYTISGTPNAPGVANAIPYNKAVTLTASDEEGNTGTIRLNCLLNTADVKVKVGKETAEVGNSTDYTWYAATGYTSTGAKTTVTITNDSKVNIKLKGALTTGNKFTLGSNKDDIQVAKEGGTATLEISPKEGETSITDTLTLSGDGFATTTIDLKFNAVAAPVVINKPEDEEPTVKDYAERSFEIGRKAELKFESTKGSTVKSGPVYTIVTAADADLAEAILDNTNGTFYGTEEVARMTAIKAAAASALDEDTLRNTYGLTLGRTSGILQGNLTGTAGEIWVLVKASYVNVEDDVTEPGTDINVNRFAFKAVKITVANAADALSVMDGSTKLKPSSTVSLGDMRFDATEGPDRVFKIKNDTNATITGIKATVTRVWKKDTNGEYQQYTIGTSPALPVDRWTAESGHEGADKIFKVVYSDNAELDDKYAADGFDLAKGADKDVILAVKAADADNEMTAGEYKATVQVASTNGGIYTFATTFKITSVPTVTVYDDGSTYPLSRYAIGTKYSGTPAPAGYTAGDHYLAVDPEDANAKWNFTWAMKSGETANIADSGLRLSPKGEVYGDPVKAGTYKVVVTATKQGDTDVYGTFEDTIIVVGSSTISLRIGNTAVNGTDEGYILPGAVVGDAQKNAVQLKVTVAGEDAKGLKVTVEDAEDMRDKSNATDLADMKKNPGNPYAGSTSFIGVSKANIGDVTKGTEESIWITTKADTKPSIKKVFITVSGDNLAAPKTAFAYLFTAEKLAIDTPEALKASVGKAYIGATALEYTATGADGSQVINWAEVDLATGETTKLPSTLTFNNPNASAATTGLKATITGTPTVIGSYDLTLQATASAANVPYREDVTDSTAVVYDAKAKVVNSGVVGGFAEQKSEKVKFTLTVEGSDGIAIDYVDKDDTGVTGLGLAGGKYVGTVVNGELQEAPKGYVLGNQTVGYTNTNSALTIEYVNNAAVKFKIKPTLAKGSSSDFVITNDAEAEVNAGGKKTYTVQPKANLAAGTYTDTLTVQGEETKPVTFTLSFTVEAASYKLDAGYADNSIDPFAGADDEEREKSWAKIKNVVTAGAKTGEISLKDIKEGTSAVANDNVVSVRNSGNSALKNVKVVETNASGTPVADGTEKLVLAGLSGSTIASTGIVTLPSKDHAQFTIIPKNDSSLKPGTNTAYIAITYKEGTAEKSAVVPVKFVVYTKDGGKVKVTPTSATLKKQKEGYSKTSAKQDFVIKNDATGGDEYALHALNVSIDRPDWFELVTTETEFDDASTTKYAEYTLKNALAPSKTVTFSVQPKEGLPAGTVYTTTLTVSAPNLADAMNVDIDFEVEKSQSFKTNVYSTKAAAAPFYKSNAIDSSYAKRLWTTLQATKTSTIDSHKYTSTNAYVLAIGDMTTGYTDVEFDLNKDGTGDLTIQFAPTTGISDVAAVTGATMTLAEPIPGTTKVELSAAEVKKVPTGAEFFTDMTFAGFSVAKFDTEYAPGHEAQIVELSTALNNDNVVADVAAGSILTEDERIDYVNALVQNGSTAASVMGNKLPTVKWANNGFSGWVNGSAAVTASTVVTDDVTYTAKWHDHVYPGVDDTNENHVKWVWTGNDTDGYTDVKLFLYCVENCPSADKGVIEFSVEAHKKDASIPAPEVTVSKQEADCLHGPRTEYKASVSFGGKTYTSTKNINEDKSKAKGHKYTTTIEWKKQDDGSYKPVIKQLCSECSASTEGHEYTVPEGSIVFTKNETKTPTCIDKGLATFTITSFVDGNKKTVTGKDLAKFADYTKDIELDALGHKADFVFSDVDLEKLTGKAVVTCSVCHEELYNGSVKLTDKGDGTYSCEVTGKDGVKYTGEYADHVHVWKETWAEWKRTDATDKFSWSTSLTLTCTVGKTPETKTPAVTITKTSDDKYVDFVATATFAGKTYTSDVFTVDAETGEPTAKHEHKWKLQGWDFTTTTSATATFLCTVGKETKKVTATPTFVKENSRGDKQYIASVVGPDSQTYSKTQWFDKNGNPTSGEGIGIEGIEDEYEYTGKAIKPEPIVRDYATDTILVKGTDYSVKYENNKNVGTATITVTGKGNYGEKGGVATATFKIVDPTEGEDVANYFTIKSVKVTSKDNFTYDGTEKNPAELTIKTSEGDVKATWDGSSYNLNVDSSKEMHIKVSNNVNKGSGIVAVTGNNGKGAWVTKTATFAIKACDLSIAGDNLNIDASAATWAVKGAKAKVEVTFMSETLVEGRDYTLAWSYTNKKNVGEKAGKVTVKGKGNFTKKAEQTFDITPFQIEKVDSVAAYAGLKASGIKVTMYDGDVVVIPAKNYSIETKVYSKEGLEITDLKRYKLQAGDKINVTVKAANSNLDGEETLADIVVGANLAKAKITVPKSFTKTFTGEAIELDSDDFGSGKIQVGSYEYGEDFIITGYQNNVKKGTMTVFIQGVSDKVSGVNKFKVKIVPKKVTPAK